MISISKKLVANFNKEQTINSYEFWRVLNNTRKDEGESPIRNDQFLDRVLDECEKSNCKSFAVKNTRGNKEIQAVNLNKDEMLAKEFKRDLAPLLIDEQLRLEGI